MAGINVDFFKSDSVTHLYCKRCYEELPTWLPRWSYEVTEPYDDPYDNQCENCGFTCLD